MQSCAGLTVVAGIAPTLTVSVDELVGNGFVRRARSLLGGDRLFADRSADHFEPLFPLFGTLRFVVGKEQELATEWTATVLGLYETQAEPSSGGVLRCRRLAQYSARAGSSGDAEPGTSWCRTILVQQYLSR